jgi:DNA mismatch endonuclease (patch repair protein)
MDTVSPEKRSRMMSGIRSKGTAPELVVRSIAHRLGLRFRLHAKNLVGRPDLVFPKHRTVLFVHGCFWHRHDCGLAAVPKTRTDFWLAKFGANQQRDRKVRELLEMQGWRVLEIWECETREPERVRQRLLVDFGLEAKGG